MSFDWVCREANSQERSGTDQQRKEKLVAHTFYDACWNLVSQTIYLTPKTTPQNL